MGKRFFTSITRISDLERVPFEVAPLPRAQWASGDYVQCEVVGKPGALYRIELAAGRRLPVQPGDILVGAFGRRAATLECVGSWEDIGEDGRLHQLTGAGLFGKVTSNSSWVHSPMQLKYMGHARRGSGKLCLRDFVPPAPAVAFGLPTVIVAGTSMSAGKTLTMRSVVSLLKAAGSRVAAAKLTGAAGYKDALSYADAGADHVFDYVDAGLTSTVCPREEYAAALDVLLSRIAGTGAEVLVGEIGASPLEPYNGAAAMERLAPHMRLLALCAGDPYAVLGFCNATGYRPDFITGPAANTTASAALVQQIIGLPALDLTSTSGLDTLRGLLQAAIAQAPAVRAGSGSA
ncbi:MAG: hypothetical protein VX871_10485 [Pseudomonadota bacterium]|nr:hypothetical protein [Pseudomonadota bacterium]